MQHALDASSPAGPGSAAAGSPLSLFTRLRVALLSKLTRQAVHQAQPPQETPGARPVLPPDFIDELIGRQ